MYAYTMYELVAKPVGDPLGSLPVPKQLRGNTSHRLRTC